MIFSFDPKIILVLIQKYVLSFHFLVLHTLDWLSRRERWGGGVLTCLLAQLCGGVHHNRLLCGTEIDAIDIFSHKSHPQ